MLPPGMGSPDAMQHTDSASAAASTANLRMARKKPNPLLEFDEEGAARLMEAFPLDVGLLVLVPLHFCRGLCFLSCFCYCVTLQTPRTLDMVLGKPQ